MSRRAFLAALPIALGAQVKQPFRKARPLPAAGEFARLLDPATENIFVRLTALTSVSLLPYERNRFVSTRERILIFSSNRSGRFAPHQIDLRTGVIRQIAEPANLNPKSLCFNHQEKSILYLDGDSLTEVSLPHGMPREIAAGVTAFSLSADGTLYVISTGKVSRVNGRELVALADSAVDLWAQPNATGCLFSRATAPDERDLLYVPATGGNPALLATGRVREPFWDQDGESILFLRDVTAPNGTLLAEIHGRRIAQGDEYLVSPTSQFANFSPNSDASVFVGASRSRAQPSVVLMLRNPRRELTLCEHRSSHPAEVTPVFSPDNRRIYFESDREGKSAIYSVNVELLVEPQP